MIDITGPLRKAYYDALNGNISVPVCEQYLDTNQYPNATKYVIIQNQTVNDASLKCGINQDSSLQLDIVTIFNANSGGSRQAELIANEILELIFPVKEIVLPAQIGIKIWRGWLEGSRNITQETSTSRIFRKILILNHTITQ